MKTIIFIIMIFLPLALIASIFSTNVFNFHSPSSLMSNGKAKIGLFFFLSAGLCFTTCWTYAALLRSRQYDCIVKTIQTGLKLLLLLGPACSIAFLGLIPMSRMSSAVTAVVFVVIFIVVLSATVKAKVYNILLATAVYVLMPFLPIL
jgi:hypothetical protein